MLKRSHYIAFSLIVLLTLIVLNLPGQTAIRLKLAIGSLFLPLFGLTGSTQQLAAKTADALLPRRELLRLNEQARRENQQLRLHAIQADEAVRENNRLRELLGWQKLAPWKLRLAKVVLRDPANWWHTVHIDLGSRDGMRANLPVLTTDGLAGRISVVGLTQSQVVLLGDPNCKVSALVENGRRDTGVNGAASTLDKTLVTLGYLSGAAELKPGQAVVTSDLGGIFPKGIPIGKIVDVLPVEFGLYNEARVKVAANLSALEEVWVLIP
jgi:rod shape-determining protein MreC